MKRSRLLIVGVIVLLITYVSLAQPREHLMMGSRCEFPFIQPGGVIGVPLANVTVNSSEECGNQCCKSPNCRTFSYNKSSKTCSLFSSKGQVVPDRTGNTLYADITRSDLDVYAILNAAAETERKRDEEARSKYTDLESKYKSLEGTKTSLELKSKELERTKTSLELKSKELESKVDAAETAKASAVEEWRAAKAEAAKSSKEALEAKQTMMIVLGVGGLIAGISLLVWIYRRFTTPTVAYGARRR